MRRYCNGTDQYLTKKDRSGVHKPCDCGAFFDDEDWMVIFPHRSIHGDAIVPDSMRIPKFRERPDEPVIPTQTWKDKMKADRDYLKSKGRGGPTGRFE